MSRRRYTFAEWRARPVARFTTLAVDRDGYLSLAGKASGSDRIHFRRDFGVWDDKGVTYDSSHATVTLEVSGRARFLLYVRRGRVVSSTFAFDLTAGELRETAAILSRKRLGAWIRPGLEYLTARSPTWVKSNRPLMWAASQILASC